MRYSRYFVLIFASRAKLNSHLHIVANFDIAKHTNITGRILERFEPSRRDKGWIGFEIRCKRVLGSFPFLVTRPDLITQAPPLQAKVKAVELVTSSLVNSIIPSFSL